MQSRGIVTINSTELLTGPPVQARDAANLEAVSVVKVAECSSRVSFRGEVT
jgi:hypothetical protein